MNRLKRWRQVTFALLLAATLLAPATFAQTPAPAKEPSVKPGINESWKSPNVEPLIGTLEAESREIYRERASLAALVGPRPGSAVADVGAGSGFMVEEFARLVGPSGKVYAVDINAKLLEHIAKSAAQAGVKNITTVLTREDSVDLPANSVDIVFVCDTYHHFEFPQSSLRGILRALKRGGQLVIVDFRRLPGQSRDWVLEHVRLGEEDVVKEVAAAGFELINVHHPPFLADNYVLRFRKP